VPSTDLEPGCLGLYANRSGDEEKQHGGEVYVTLRCLVDGLLLYATLRPEPPALLAFDGEESFALEAVEALLYELVSATCDELVGLERACYRLLRRAADFRQVEDEGGAEIIV
jgi:hypothetical protein